MWKIITPTRLHILEFCVKERDLAEIAEEINKKQDTVVYHMNILELNGIIKKDKVMVGRTYKNVYKTIPFNSVINVGNNKKSDESSG